jgi:hypothetical protein
VFAGLTGGYSGNVSFDPKTVFRIDALPTPGDPKTLLGFSGTYYTLTQQWPHRRIRHPTAMQTKGRAISTRTGPVGQKCSPILLFVIGAVIVAGLTALLFLKPTSHLGGKHKIVAPVAQKQ